jgi:hypothetical protein
MFQQVLSPTSLSVKLMVQYPNLGYLFIFLNFHKIGLFTLPSVTSIALTGVSLMVPLRLQLLSLSWVYRSRPSNENLTSSWVHSNTSTAICNCNFSFVNLPRFTSSLSKLWMFASTSQKNRICTSLCFSCWCLIYEKYNEFIYLFCFSVKHNEVSIPSLNSHH